MRWKVLICAVFLAGCEVTTTGGEAPQPRPTGQQQQSVKAPSSTQLARFRQVVARVEPVAERECQARGGNVNCDFNVVLDDRPGRPPNAFQTLDRSGRPILAFTAALIADVRNEDELAFIFAHEASHHIRRHIPRQQQSAAAGAILLGGLATLAGAGTGAVDAATNVGASVGARSYSKEFELEADALGTIIAKKSGYNPIRGAEYFTRIPDPGNRFLGSHPPNAQRIETVRRVNAQF
ncbi:MULTISPECIES: M48 family metalloprotease [unclassified Roseovarius]|uniref:M48 family metalloprotease n=1 Tax=unclassified Roseovarius TaxID=2614913 RepID=UPI00273FFCC3|nr:M48 family metalloprotease [Roseovarius sp. MMSF_3350]